MVKSIRLPGVLVLVAASLASVGLGQSEWTQSLLGQPHTGIVEVSPPSPATRHAFHRFLAKTTLVTRLRLGEVSLFDVAAAFRRLGDECGPFPDHSWTLFPGHGRNEKVCRQIICWAEGLLTPIAPESEVRALQERLEDALADHLAKHGKVILPGFPE